MSDITDGWIICRVVCICVIVRSIIFGTICTVSIIASCSVGCINCIGSVSSIRQIIIIGTISRIAGDISIGCIRDCAILSLIYRIGDIWSIISCASCSVRNCSIG